MAVLTDDIKLEEKPGHLVDSPVVASDIIYQGALVKHNAAGYIAPAAAESGAVFAGVAYERVDNSSGAAGDKMVRVIKMGTFLLTGSGFTQANVGASVYASDDQTISTTQGTNEQEVGKIVKFVSATQVWVKIDNVAV